MVVSSHPSFSHPSASHSSGGHVSESAHASSPHISETPTHEGIPATETHASYPAGTTRQYIAPHWYYVLPPHAAGQPNTLIECDDTAGQDDVPTAIWVTLAILGVVILVAIVLTAVLG